MEKAAKNLDLITKYFTDFTTNQLQQLGALEELYNEWNNKINVISRKDIGSLYEKHVLHSLSIAAVFDLKPGMEVIDIGTGGGFPGIPLAVFFPQVEFHLVDSTGKKINVVNAVVDALQLKNVTTQHTRAEDIRNRRFDTVVSRAVAPLVDLVAWANPLLKRKLPKKNTSLGISEDEEQPVEGLICLKGGDLRAEIAESEHLPVSIEIYDLFPEDYFKEKYVLFIG